MVQTRLPDDVPPPSVLHSAYLNLLADDSDKIVWNEEEHAINDHNTIYNWSWCRKCATV